MKLLRIWGIIVLLAVVLAILSLFTVNEREKALLLRLGEVVRVYDDAGLYFKVPFIDTVRRFDARTQTLDAPPERYLTSEKKNVIVDAFVKWRVQDVIQFYTTMGGSADRANVRMAQIVKDGLRDEFGKRTIQEVISGERIVIMEAITRKVGTRAQEFGIAIVDARVKRIDLPRDVSDSVYNRMRAERQRVAKELRSQGAEEAEKIRAAADRERTVLLAEAYKASEEIRGEGDAASTAVYAQAFSQDTDFYHFYRTLQAYRQSLRGDNTVFVFDTDHAFFNYLGGMQISPE